MIGQTFPLGKGFGGLARYLETGTSGEERDRVAWTETRNLPTEQPQVAARLMAATASCSERVQRPVYHLSISFDPGDGVDRAGMRRVADAVLKRLGLEEHEALIVAHKDTAHPHMHLVVNRVHPEKRVAWENFRDWPKIEQALRAEEVALGLRVVPGKHARVPGQERAPLLLRGDPVFLHRAAQRAVPVLERARSWAEVDAGLAAEGLALRVKGGGLVVHDATHEVKASDLGREFSRAHLEKRFGKHSAHRQDQQARGGVVNAATPAPAPAPLLPPEPVRLPEPVRDPAPVRPPAPAREPVRPAEAVRDPAPVRPLEPPAREPVRRREPEPPTAAEPPVSREEAFARLLEAERQRVREAANAGHLAMLRQAAERLWGAVDGEAKLEMHFNAESSVERARRDLQWMADKQAHAGMNRSDLRAALGRVYRDDADEVMAKLAAYEREHGAEAAQRILREKPETFGRLHRRRPWWGLGLVSSSEEAVAQAGKAVAVLRRAQDSAREEPRPEEVRAARARLADAERMAKRVNENVGVLRNTWPEERQAVDVLRQLLREGAPEEWIRQELGRLLPPGGATEKVVQRAVGSARPLDRDRRRGRGIDFF